MQLALRTPISNEGDLIYIFHDEFRGGQGSARPPYPLFRYSAGFLAIANL